VAVAIDLCNCHCTCSGTWGASLISRLITARYVSRYRWARYMSRFSLFTFCIFLQNKSAVQIKACVRYLHLSERIRAVQTESTIQICTISAEQTP
jgi:hypothetical protein